MRNLYLIILLVCASNLSGQRANTNYSVYQLKNSETSERHIAKIVRFDKSGNKVFEKYQGYTDSHVTRFLDVEISYIYEDTLQKTVIKRFMDVMSRDSVRIDYIYNSQNQFIQTTTTTYTFSNENKHQTKDQLEDSTTSSSKGYTESTYSNYFLWNNKGLMSDYYTTEETFGEPNHYCFDYDGSGNRIKESAYWDDLLMYEKYINPLVNGHDFFVNSDPVVPMDAGTPWPERLKIRQKKDSRGNITQEVKTGINGELFYRIKTQYDDKNRIVKQQRYDNNDVLFVTHWYTYEEK